jgi:hypothetical protein
MALTVLDPQTALIVVDLQKGLRNMPAVHPIAGVIEHVCRLVEDSLTHVFPRLGETGSTQDVLDLLAGRSAGR